MITNFIFLFIFKQIFNYDYYFHIKVNLTCNFSINQNNERTINNLNEDVIIPKRNRPLEEVIKFKIKSIHCVLLVVLLVVGVVHIIIILLDILN